MAGYDRNKGVQGIIDDIDNDANRVFANEYPYNAKFNIYTGRITHSIRGSVLCNPDYRHLIDTMYPIFKNNVYVGYASLSIIYKLDKYGKLIKVGRI